MVEHHNSPEIITVRDIWEQLNVVGQNVSTIKQNVSTIETKMDTVVARANDHELRLRTVEQLFALLNDVPERLVKVEHRLWSIPSFASVLALVSLGITIWRSFH